MNSPIPDDPQPIEQVSIYVGDPLHAGLALISVALTLLFLYWITL
jgi:hypothetical protein